MLSRIRIRTFVIQYLIFFECFVNNLFESIFCVIMRFEYVTGSDLIRVLTNRLDLNIFGFDYFRGSPALTIYSEIG